VKENCLPDFSEEIKATIIYRIFSATNGTSARYRARFMATANRFWCFEHTPDKRLGTIFPRSVIKRSTTFWSL